MTAISVNDDHDIYLNEAGNLALVSGIQQVLQQCDQIMKLRLGEAVYSAERGIPYYQTVFDRLLVDRFEAAGRAAILSVPGVTEISAFDVSVNGSTLGYSASIITIYGEGRVSG